MGSGRCHAPGSESPAFLLAVMPAVLSCVCCEPRTLTGALAVAFCPRTAVRRLRICLALDLRSTQRTLRFRPVRPAPPARDAIPGNRPDRPCRPVRPALSLALPTRRSVARDRRARVRMRIDAGTYAAAKSAMHADQEAGSGCAEPPDGSPRAKSAGEVSANAGSEKWEVGSGKWEVGSEK